MRGIELGSRHDGGHLTNAHELVRLQTKLPLRMSEAVLEREPRIAREFRPIHWLQVEVVKCVPLEVLRLSLCLRVNELQFIAAPESRYGAGLRADADPVNANRWFERAVCLNRDF